MLGTRPKENRGGAWLVMGSVILLAGACAPVGTLRDRGAPSWDGLAYVAMGPGKGPGHIPGAVNVDWVRNLTPTEPRQFKAGVELARLYRRVGVTPDKEILVYCRTGSGVPRVLRATPSRIPQSAPVRWLLRGVGGRPEFPGCALSRWDAER